MNNYPVIDDFFERDGNGDIEALIELFLHDAVVKDEKASHRGVNAIRAWWEAAKRKYGHVAEPIEMIVTDNHVAVRAKVCGQFPNSPVTLKYLFSIEEDKIAELEIQP